MNLDDLLTKFYREAEDTAIPHLFGEEDVTAWLIEAEEEACIRSKLLFERDDQRLCVLQIRQGIARVDFDDSITAIVHAHIVVSATDNYPLSILDREELDRTRPNWRTTTDRPTALVWHDTHLQTDCIPDADYTVEIEVYRLPKKAMSKLTDRPEIHLQHHKFLTEWALYKGYAIPDRETYDTGKSSSALARFEKHFGVRPSANGRKNEFSNRPHHVKAHW